MSNPVNNASNPFNNPLDPIHPALPASPLPAFEAQKTENTNSIEQEGDKDLKSPDFKETAVKTKQVQKESFLKISDTFLQGDEDVYVQTQNPEDSEEPGLLEIGGDFLTAPTSPPENSGNIQSAAQSRFQEEVLPLQSDIERTKANIAHVMQPDFTDIKNFENFFQRHYVIQNNENSSITQLTQVSEEEGHILASSNREIAFIPIEDIENLYSDVKQLLNIIIDPEKPPSFLEKGLTLQGPNGTFYNLSPDKFIVRHFNREDLIKFLELKLSLPDKPQDAQKKSDISEGKEKNKNIILLNFGPPTGRKESDEKAEKREKEVLGTIKRKDETKKKQVREKQALDQKYFNERTSKMPD